MLATAGGVGLARAGSGTWGSAVAVPIAYLIMLWVGPWGLLAAAAIAFGTGIWASQVIGKSGEKDSSVIVIDEVAGQWLTLTVAGLNPWLYLIGFALFRLIDIAKPWPISWMDRKIAGAFGVMIDDIAAGGLALVCLWLIGHLWS
ncbi:MAG: phosphatidylglycerophosphatase A [Pseudomonadota bacterium]